MDYQIPETAPAEYIKNRVDDQIAYYNKKGGKNKRWHIYMQTAIIVCGALIPLLIGYTENWQFLKYVVAGFGALIAICQGIYSLNKYAETWHLYRNTAEALNREKFLFQNGVGDYQDPATRFRDFVLRCEQIMSTENSNWIAVVGKKENAKSNAENQ